MCAWSAPYTFGSAEQVSASTLNTYVSDNLTWLYDNRFDATNYGATPLLATGTQLTPTATYADIPGGSITLGGSGHYALYGGARMHLQAPTDGNYRYVYVRLVCGGVVQAGTIALYAPNTTDLHQARWWTYTAGTSGVVAKLQGYASGETNTIKATDTRIVAYQTKAPNS